MSCCHSDTYELPAPWPTGESIEVCNCCGMSRAHCEWDETLWHHVDIFEARAQLDRLVKNAVRRVECVKICKH